MEKKEIKEWMALNRIIYKIYGDEDEHKMREDFLEHINMFIDFDSAYFYLVSNESELAFDSPAVYQCEADDKISFDSVPGLNEILRNKKTIVFRETDIFKQDEWESSTNYNMFYKPDNWYYGMRLILAMDKKVLGIVTLFRSISKKNFDLNDVLMLDLFKEHLSLRLNMEKKSRYSSNALNVVSYDNVEKKYKLTKKERVVVELLSKGESVEQISERLDVSVNTVKKHTVNIYRKLGINKRIQLFQMFLEP